MPGRQAPDRSDSRGDKLASTRQFFMGTYDRLRTVEATIDGNLWMATSDAAADKDSVPDNTTTKLFKVTLKPSNHAGLSVAVPRQACPVPGVMPRQLTAEQ